MLPDELRQLPLPELVALEQIIGRIITEKLRNREYKPALAVLRLKQKPREEVGPCP